MMARICSVCGKKADTMLQSANTVGSAVICWDCYLKIKHFSKQDVFETPEALEENEAIVMQELQDNRFPESVIEEYRKYYAMKKNPALASGEDPVMITTTPEFSGYQIREYKGLVSGEVVIGTGMLSGMEAGVADMFGSEASAYGEKIDAAESVAARRAYREACRKGGNAIVGAKLDLELFARDLICVMVSGTAVWIQKEKENEEKE